MGTLLVSTICHYCGEKAQSQDHIVPQSALPKPQSKLPYWWRANNIVPACFRCNGEKAYFRSDCECDQCTWAWTVGLKKFVLPTYTHATTIVAIVRTSSDDSRRQDHRRLISA